MVLAYLLLHFFFAEQFYHNPLKRGRGPTALARAWHFVPLVLRMSDDDIEKYAGLDALALLEFIWCPCSRSNPNPTLSLSLTRP